jgi:hypothetical protein
MKIKEALFILLAAVILSFSVSFPRFTLFFYALVSFIIIISLSIIAKKLVAYHYEARAEVRFWEWYQFYWGKKSHFKRPIPMFWLAPLLSLISLGYVWFLAILEYDVQPNPERVSKRHGIYRFTEMTDTQVAAIGSAGVVMCFILAMLGYVIGLGLFSKLATYYAIWSLVPIGSLDGSRILFGSRVGWMTLLVIAAIFFSFSVFVV